MVGITMNKGYPIETHYVTTDDKYILTTFRIGYGRNETSKALNSGKPVVMLQHGLLDSSWTWVNNFPNQSLAFILADHGYGILHSFIHGCRQIHYLIDVWLGNNRGNHYSKRHVTWETNSEQFWNFSYDEMAKYDAPNTIDYILEYTKQSKLAYVGHSEGTIQVFAMPTFRRDVVSKIAFYGALAPIAYVHHQKSPLLKILADLDVANIYALLGRKQFLPGEYLLNRIAPDLCVASGELCADAIELLCGPTNDINASRMDVYGSETPAGTSVKNMIHWSQDDKRERFGMFDYGTKEANMQHYGPNYPKPPDYNLSLVTMPLGLYSGSNDWLADPEDVSTLRADLPNGVIKQDVYVQGFAHLDFTWGMKANEKVYLEPNLLTAIKTYLGQGKIVNN